MQRRGVAAVAAVAAVSWSGWPAGDVVDAARGGDASSLVTLIENSHPHVRRFAFSLCASPEDAEDAAQEALLVLYRKIGTLRASAALASWAFQIVRSECLRRLRDRHWAGPDLGLETDAESAEGEVLRRLEVDALVEAIGALPHDQRMVLVMRDVQGLPGGVVARRLGLSQAGMKSRLHRARAQLRSQLRPPDERVAS